MSVNFTTRGVFPGRSVSITTLGRFKSYGTRIILAVKTFLTKSENYFWKTGQKFFR